MYHGGAHKRASGGTVEVAGAQQRPTLAGELLGELPGITRTVPNLEPQVEPSVRHRDVETRPPTEHIGQPFQAVSIAAALDLDVDVIVEGDDASGLARTRDHHPDMLADLPQVFDEFRIACVEPDPGASQIRPLGQRMNGDDSVKAMFENRASPVDPSELDIALIRKDGHAVFATPRRGGTEVVERSARIGGTVDPQRQRPRRIGGINL